MTLTDLLRELQNRDIDVYFHGGKLRCNAPRGALDVDLRSAIDVYRAEIYTLFATADKLPSVEPVSRSAPLPLSFAQQRLWFLDQLQPGDAAYNIPAALRVIGDFDTAAFAFAVNEIVRRHEVLRTAFVLRDGVATQVIAPALAIATPIIDLGGLDQEMREAEALRLAAEEARHPFDLATGPLLRVKTLDLGIRPATAERERVVLFTMHHIVSDGWSSGVLLREFVELYEAFVAGRPSPLPELAIQYADYAVWQREWLQGDVLDRQLAYWREKLGGAPPALDLPTDHARPARQDHAGARRSFTIGKHVADRLASLGRDEGATLFMTLLAAFQLLLSRYSGQHDISVGTPVANRRRLELEELIGFFVNTLVMRADLSGDPSFRVLLARVRETALGAQAHQDLPFERLVEELRPVRDMSRDPLFQVMFSLQNAPKSAAAVSGLRFEPLASEGASAKFDLTLSIAETDKGLVASIEYATALFEASTIDRMARHYCALLEGIASDPDRRIGELDMLEAAERHRLLVEWNDTATDYPQDKLVHELFEEQAARAPEAVALVYEGAQLSYGELNERANRLAHHLRALGVGPDVIVGLCVERSFEMIVALLGVLKAGGAYLPIDPDYPKDRIAYMIADAAPALVLTQDHLRARLPETIATLRLDADWSVIAEQSAANRAPRATSQNLAYVIYTSGSTGRPKGVGVEHGGLQNRLSWMQERFGLTVDDIVLQKTPYGFDVSVWEFFWPLREGARLILLSPKRHGDPKCLEDIIDRERVTTLHFVPSMLRAFVNTSTMPTFANLRRVLCSGEELPADLVEQFHGAITTELSNLYGPTEASIDVTVYPCLREVQNKIVPIGRPISNTQIYLLDPTSEPVPIGVAGELHIGGAGLARGYLGRPDLTAERFVPNPFGRAGERVYRTGDLARYRADGNIEFLGRIDHQVKIRGFRIELGEIEAALTRLPQLREAVAIAREDSPGDKRLVAYMVAAEGAALEAAELRGALARELPDYMIPSAFVPLDALPLTPNGKIDRRRLPAPDLDAQIAHSYVAPRNATEETLCRIFADVLGLERVGVDDDFFQLGGHSLLAVQIVSRIWRELERQLPLRSLFASPRIADFAAQLDVAVGEAALPDIRPVSRSAPLPLSFAQQRLWFLDQLQPGDAAYNIPAALRVIGDFDTAAFAFAVNEIVRRHEVLRTAFVLRDGVATQVIAPALAIATPIIDLGGLDQEMREAEALRLAAEEARHPFDLATGPLLRVKTLDLGIRPATAERERVVLFTMHHIVSDGWSSGVLLREFVELYEAFVAGRPSPLPELAIQYADYAVWQRQWLQGDVLDRQLTYWREKLGGAPPALDLPTDHARPARQDHAGARRSFTIGKHIADRLASLGREEGATLFMTLLAAFQLLLSRYSGQHDISVGTPVANRRRLELEELIGFFVNTLVMRADLSGDPSFRVLLARVRETALGAQAHQDLPFERLVEELRPVRDMSRDPLFQVMFSLQNAPKSAAAVSGLRFEPLASEGASAKFDLTLSIAETDKGLVASIEYATALFEASTIDRMARHYCALLEGIASDPDRRIGELDMLEAAERHRLLVEWNDTAADYPQDKLVHELFEEQAARAPEAVALVYEGAQLSYGELNERANRLAHHLRSLGVGPDAIVGLCVERSFEMIVALLGVLKAGGAYLPIDPDYPKDRIAYMIADAAPALVLTQDHLRARLPQTITTLRLDADWSVIAEQSAANLAPRATSQNLAYVIYTSGSTGRPKGVGVSHDAIACRLEWMQERFGLTVDDIVLQKTPYGFDVSVWEFFWPLRQGARLSLAPPGSHRSPEHLMAIIEADMVTTLHFVPSMLRAFLDAPKLETLPSLRRVLCGGEALTPDLRDRFIASHAAELHHLYGPTEASIDATAHRCDPDQSDPLAPIGRPISNTQIYLLDSTSEPVPIGVAGELHIGGAGLARGYLGRPDLTAERFVPNPFGQAGERVYRTGDLARYRADGNIEFLGRIDHQVKIRGFRIELGEIEAALTRLPQLREAVVIAREDSPGDKRLVAYVVAAEGAALETAELRGALARELPDYMIPSAFVPLDALPLTPNGKIDRRRLPAPDLDAQIAHSYVAPRNATEETLCRIFADVLGLERVGVDDDFFQLGGHSLLAITLVERARLEHLQTDVRTLFANPTPARLSAAAAQNHAAIIVPPNLVPLGCDAITPDMLTLAALSQSDIDRIVAAVPGGAANVQDIYPLAPLQEGILFHHLMATEGDPYLLPTLLAFDTHARLDAFLAALRAVIARHDILRTAVVWEGLPEPMQVVWRDATLIVEEISLDAAAGDVAEQLRQRFDPRNFRLDIRQAPMIRGFLAHDCATDRWLLLILSHHLASDHTTSEVVVEEARAHLLGESEKLLAPLAFRDFVAQARLGVAREEHEAFFRSMLGDVSEPTAPFGLIDARGDGSGVGEARLVLNPNLARRLRERARALGVSPASLCHQAFAQLLARASGHDDVVFGTVLFGRMHGGAGADRAVGLFINTLPLRVRLGVEGVAEAVRRTHELLTELLHHEHASLALAQRCSGVPAPAPLFAALLNYRHSPARQETSDESARAWDGLVSLYSESRNNYPLTVSVDDFRDDFQLVAQTRSPLDPERICAYMNVALEKLVEALEHSPQTLARTIDILPQDERHRLLVEWNDTATDYPQERLLHELFEAQAARAPEAVALVFEGAQLSYGELNERANRLAHRLRALGVGPDVIVGLCVERSFEMIVALLGVLKAGGAYLPIDPDYPKDRIAYMIADAAPALVLTQDHLRARLPETITTLRLDADWSKIAEESAANLTPRATPQNLAYVIYTSGSTGKPKGVGVIHSGVANYTRAIKGRIADRIGLRFALVSTPAADLGYTSLFASIASGGCLHLFAKETTADAHAMNAYLAQNGVDVIKITPSHYDVLTQARHVAPAARHEVLVFGGEPLRAEMLERIVANDRARRIYNHYGPTETTVGALMSPAHPAPAAGDPPIGRPLDNVQAYVVDATCAPVPIGVAGELYIGGAGLARGYLGRPDLTAERFVPNPFDRTGERLYRTGDLVRYRPDGNIEFLGRVDDQVKIRGFRIELGEIEAALTRLPQLRAAVVLAREDQPGERRLVAYVAMAEGAALETGELRDALARDLPDYMIPSLFVALDALPLTPNGKIDRRALPAPEVDAASPRGYIAPRNATEATLCRLFAEVLRVERVGVDDDFFQLGGHSLLAIQLVARIKRHGLQADVRTLFANPNPSALAAAAGGGAANFVAPPNLIPPVCDAITPDMLTLATLSQAEIERIVAGVPGGAANVQDIYPLAPLQEGILFHHLLTTEGDPYLIQTLLAFDTRERVDAFLDALRAVIARHDILRTAIVWEALPEPMQLVWRNAPLIVEELDAVDGDAAEQLRLRFDPRRFRLDVRQAPMLHGALAHDPATGRWLMLILSHHLALDHATRDIVVEEARTHLLGESSALVAPAPFRNFVAQTRSGTSRAEHEAFFRAMLGDVTEPTAPFGLLDIVGDIASIGSARSRLEPDMARRLRERARALGVSPASLFHLAFAQLLARASGRDDVVFGTVLFGRMHSGDGVERAVGLYMNTLPLRVRLGVEGTAEALRRLHVSLTELMRHEHASLALTQSCSGVAAPTPLFSALLNYRHSRPRQALSETRTALDEIGWLEAAEQRTNYPLGLSIDDLGDGFVLTAQTRSPLDPERICAYMNVALEGLVEALEHSPQTPARTIDILPQDERHRLLVEWNDTATDYPQDRLVHELFEAQAARAPEAVALVFEGVRLSYGELNERANRLAHHLRALGVGPDVIVGLCVERSFEMIVALLGVLKAGGAYLPIDPDYPKDRIAYMIADAAPALVLTQDHLRARLPQTITTLRLDADWSKIAEESAANLAPRATSQNLAYVIYTSGSTGKPKGVGVTHRGIPDLAVAQRDCFGICDRSRVLQFANATFDASVSEIAMALTSGAGLVLAPWDQRSGDGLADILVEERITHATLPPAVMPTLTPSSAFVLECLVVAGEACSADLTSRWADGRRLINAYGPTETTVCATLSGPLNSGEAPPIGRPIRNTQIYLVDPASELVPVGVAGELYIGGAGLARGYLGRPDLTAERFLPNPFGEAGERLYRTGDLARYRANGEIEFLERIDHQVKINGFRIELGEIEAALVNLPQIRESVVIARENASGDKRLVAYSITTDGVALDEEELHMALAAELPDYMIPSAFVALDALPLTANGKIDHSALPAPNFDTQIALRYVGPRTVSEYVLAREFCAVLQLERIGIHDNFFRKGGHSLSGAKLVERIRRTLCSNLPVTAIFQAPTIAQLAEWISNFDRHAQSPLVVMRSAGTMASVPLYCIHPGGGSIIRYQPFVDAMTGSRAVYGIQSRNLIDPSYVCASIEEMARDYVDLIRRNQPRGPYMLLGWSSGGSVAMKMTEILEQSGETVAFLGLLDTAFSARKAPVEDPSSSADTPRSGRNAEAPPQRKPTALDYLAGFAKIEGIEIDDRLSSSDREQLMELSLRLDGKELYIYSAMWGQERGFWANISPELMDFLYSDREKSFELAKDLVLNQVRAPIHIWWCSRSIERSGGFPCDWRELTSAAVHTEVVSGDHESIVVDPLVHAQIIDVLDSLQA